MGLQKKTSVWHKEPVNAAKRVVITKFCIKCGCNLRGQSIEGLCPTCAHPVYDSVYGAYLIDTPPEETHRLHDISNVVFYPALFLTGLLLVMLVAELADERTFVGAVEAAFNALFAGAMLSPLIALVGSVVFTGRHSAAYFRAKYGNPRFMTIAGVVLAAALVALGSALTYGGTYARVVLQTAFVAIPAGLFLERLGGLMRRVPNQRLATYCNVAVGGLWALAAAALAIQLLQPARQDHPDLAGFVVALTFVVDLGGAGLIIGTLRLLVLARRTLRAIYAPTVKPGKMSRRHRAKAGLDADAVVAEALPAAEESAPAEEAATSEEPPPAERKEESRPRDIFDELLPP